MKTSLVVKGWDGKFERASTPEDGVGQARVPRYRPRHRVTGSRVNPRTGRRESSWTEPQSVSTRYNRFHVKSGRIERVRHLPDRTVSELQELDRQRKELRDRIDELYAEERRLLELTFDRCRQVKVEEVKKWSEAR